MVTQPPPPPRYTPAMRHATLLPLLVTLAAILTGCAAEKPARFTITQDQYDAAFSAAREELRGRHFDLARVDARAGIITTQPASSAGLATPWIDHTDTFEDSVDGVTQRERRRVEVRFLTAAAPALPETEVPELDVRAQPGPYEVDVRVIVERIYQPGRRPDATSVRVGSFYQDPELVAKGEQPRFAVDHREDPRLAGRIAQAIERSTQEISAAAPRSE